jgi:hypothetical protein
VKVGITLFLGALHGRVQDICFGGSRLIEQTGVRRIVHRIRALPVLIQDFVRIPAAPG